MLETARTEPGAGNNLETMAAAIGITSRTLQRWRRQFDVRWPPIGDADWQALLNQARASQPRAAPTWMVVCTITAASLTDIEAQLGDVTILKIERLSPEQTDTRHASGLS